LNVVGLVDPVAERAQAVLQAKNLTMAAPAYAHTKVYKSIADATKALAQKPPALVLLGSPPAFRGRLTPGIDAEKQLVDAFPESGLFVEKPVSTGTVEDASDVAKMLKDKRNVSVGYMLRYSKAVQKMKEIIKENELTVMMTSARYVMGESPVSSPTNDEVWLTLHSIRIQQEACLVGQGNRLRTYR
jgi:predicted dehydrogenase